MNVYSFIAGVKQHHILFSRHRAEYKRWAPDCWLAGRSNRKCVVTTGPRKPQESCLRSFSWLNLRICERCVRQGEDAGQVTKLHIPVSPRHQETDEEIWSKRPPGGVHFTKFVPKILLRPGSRGIILPQRFSENYRHLSSF